MKPGGSFVNAPALWNFTTIWAIDAPVTPINNGYPYLRATQAPTPPVGQVPEAPCAAALPVAGLFAGAWALRVRRRPTRLSP